MSSPNVSFFQNSRPAMDLRYYWEIEKNPFKNCEVSILARINDLDAWMKLTDVNFRSEIKVDNEWIVTAQIKLTKFKALSELSYVISLKFGEKNSVAN